MKRFLAALLVVTGLTVASFGTSAPASALNVFSGACGGGSSSGTSGSTGSSTGAGGSSAGTNLSGTDSGKTICDGKGDDLNSIMKNIINVVLTVLGMIAVIMIIIGGIRYTTSNGDASQIQSAKNTILYAVVGLVVAILAFAIVNFVIGAFK